MRIAGILLIFIVSVVRGQDADTIVLKDDDRKFTVVSQIEDQNEAAAFLAMLSAKDVRERYDLAAKFLKMYPQSWLLSQVYDALARSATDLGNIDEGLANGRLSLRLLPENASLLVLMANMEAKQDRFGSAIDDADKALGYLRELERPPRLSLAEWNAVRPQLESSAYFARGRVEASRGLAASSATILQAALRDLDKAAAWNADDPEIFYLRGIVEVKLQQKSAAASDLRFVFGRDAALHEKAKNVLAILSGEKVPFDSFLSSLPERRIDPGLRKDDRHTMDSRALSQGYAGPEACRACHQDQYMAWRQTGMARMLQPYRPENIMGDFTSWSAYSESRKEGIQPDVIRLGIAGRPYFELKSQGIWSRYYVDFTIGSKWQQAYATKLSDGRLQVLPIEYNLEQKRWINYWKMIDPPGSPRANIAEFPKLTAATNYQQNCAICHTSQLKADLAVASPMEHATFIEPGIDCEMCHGPSAWHIKAANSGNTKHTDPDQPPVDFKRVDNREGVRACAQCHQQSAVREFGEGGEMNYSTKTNFIPASWLRPYDAFSRKAFYKDGRFRETTFIVEAFTRSACYLRGSAQCATCHSPHLPNFNSNQTSLKFHNEPNEMCLECHSEYRARVVTHSRHAAGSEAAQCISCHMPRIVNALLFKARSHQIEVPTADLTQRFGQNESPNVCLTCHSEKSPAWAQEQLAEWPH